jgi:hypothetical protein
LILHLEDGLGDTIKDLSRIGQGHPLSEAIEKFDFVMLLKTLDTLRDSGLGDIQRSCGGTEAPVFCGHVEDLQLIEIHNLKLFIGMNLLNNLIINQPFVACQGLSNTVSSTIPK